MKEECGMWKRLLQLLGLSESPACKAAYVRLQEQYPDLVACGTQVVKQEARRCVVAVFYKDPEVVVRPDSYKLFAVSEDLSFVEELPLHANSPYWIRGRK